MPSLQRFHSGKEHQNLWFCVSRGRPMDPDFRNNRVPGNLFVSQNCFDSHQDFICGCSRLARQHRVVFILEIVERIDQIGPRLQNPSGPILGGCFRKAIRNRATYTCGRT
jgi:hypothetical protein